MSCIKTKESAAWEEFISRFHRCIVLTVVRTARQWGETSEAVIEDLTQDTYLKICQEECRVLRRFQSLKTGTFRGYLTVVVANFVHDHFKGAQTAKRGKGRRASSLEDLKHEASDQASSAREIEQNIFANEVKSALKRLSASRSAERDCRIFWLYYRHGITANAIAGLPTVGLSVKGVESVIGRLARLVRAELTGIGAVSDDKKKRSTGESSSAIDLVNNEEE